MFKKIITFKTLIEQTLLKEDYSQKVYNELLTRMGPQAGPHIAPDDIRQMIKRFGQLSTSQTVKPQITNLIQKAIRNGELKARAIDTKDKKRLERLNNNPLDIMNYDYAALDIIIHGIRTQGEIEKENRALRQSTSEDTGAKLISKHNGLNIYLGQSGKECTQFNNYMKKKTADVKFDTQPYNWCIGWAGTTGQTNRFDAYRYQGESAYYVEDPSLNPNNEMSCIVVHAIQNGEYRITNLYNDKEKIVNWEGVLNWQPKLKGAEKIIKFNPYNEQEQLYKITKDASAKDFDDFTRYNVKEAYINSGKKIYVKSYLDLPAELQHLYINVRAPGVEQLKEPDFWMSLLDDSLFEFNDNKERYNTVSSVNGRMEKAQELAASNPENEAEFMAPILDSPIIKQSKKATTYKYWCKLVDESMNGNGAAYKRTKN